MRPESHRVGDLAETLAQEVFLASGWIVNRCLSDYGYDFFVMRDVDSNPRPGFAFLQVKGLGGDASGAIVSLSFAQVETRHLRQWENCPIPVLLCIVNVMARSVYVVSAKEIVDSLQSEHGAEWDSTKSRRVTVTSKHLFSDEVAGKLLREIEDYWAVVRQAWISVAEGGARMAEDLPRAFPSLYWVTRFRVYLLQRRFQRSFGREASHKLLGMVGLDPVPFPGWLFLKAAWLLAALILPAGVEKLKANRKGEVNKCTDGPSPKPGAAQDG